jgi:hypothetical protein
MGRRIIFILFGLVPVFFAGAEETPAVYTNARGGTFTAEQWLWFAVPQGEELRLVLDKAEIYRGPGPGMVHLNSQAGEARGFELSARRISPGGLTESLDFFIVVDRKTVHLPERALRLNEGGYAVLLRGEEPGRVLYVSGRPPGETENSGFSGDGSREYPFVFLDEAVELAKRTGVRDIRLSGPVWLRKNLDISGDMTISGFFEPPGTPGAGMIIPDKTGIRVSGGILRLRGITLERPEGGGAVFLVESGAGLELADSAIAVSGPLVRAEDRGVFLIMDSLVLSRMPGERRFPVLSAGGGRVYAVRSRFEVEGRHGLFLDMKGGEVSVEDSVFLIKAQKTGTLFNLDQARADCTGLNAAVFAEDYGSAMELSGSRLVMTGGTLTVSARDGVILLTDAADTLCAGTGFFLASSFAAAAMEIRGRFPFVSDCLFVFAGSASRAEVFSRPNAGTTPPGGTIAGNVFKGFSHILGNEYPVQGIAGFNRSFAPAQKPNSVAE